MKTATQNKRNSRIKIADDVIKTRDEVLQQLKDAKDLLGQVDTAIKKTTKQQQKLPDIEEPHFDDADFDKLIDEHNKLSKMSAKLSSFRDRIQKRIEKLTEELKHGELFNDIKYIKDESVKRSDLAEKYSEAAKIIVAQFRDLLINQIIPAIPDDPKFEVPLFKVVAKIEQLADSMREIATIYRRDVLSRTSILLAPATYNVLAEGFIDGLKKNDGVELEAKTADNDIVTEEQKRLFERRRRQTQPNKEPLKQVQIIINKFVPRMADIMTAIPHDKRVTGPLLKQAKNISDTVIKLTSHTSKFKKIYPDASLAILAYINMIKSIEIALKMALNKK